jgi:hypothetical protein
MRAWVWKWSFPRSPLFQNSQSCQISNLAKRKGRNWKMWHHRGNWSVLLYCSNWNMYCLVLFEVIVFLLFFSGQESISHSFAISPIVFKRCMDSTPETWCYCSKRACIKFRAPPPRGGGGGGGCQLTPVGTEDAPRRRYCLQPPPIPRPHIC